MLSRNIKSITGKFKRYLGYNIILVAVLVVVFFVLFVPSLRTFYKSPYYFDEAYSIYIARMSWVRMEYVLLHGADTHPPLYNNLLKFWMIFSTSYVWIRLSSTLMALGSLIVVYQICRKNFNEKVGVFSVLIIASSRLFIWLGGFISMYAFFLLLSSLSVYYFFKLLQKPDNRVRAYYIFSTALGMYTHWFFAYVLMSEALFLLWNKRNLKTFAGIYLPIGLLCTPLIPFLISEMRVLEYSSVYLFTIWVDKFSVNSLVDLLVVITTTEVSGILFLVALTIGLASKAVKAPRLTSMWVKTPGQIKFFLVLATLPILLSILVDKIIEWNLFIDRHFVFLLIPTAIIISYFVVNSQKKAVAVLLIMAITYNFYYIAKDEYSLMQYKSEEKQDEMAENSRYDVILYMSPHTFFPSVVYDWNSRDKHKLVYDTSTERNPLIDYAIGSGVINESNFITSCDELTSKNALLRPSGSFANDRSLKKLIETCRFSNDVSDVYEVLSNFNR